MKVDQRFHCFGCGEDGDVIDFTAKLFDLSPKEAAEKLAQDFGLIYDLSLIHICCEQSGSPCEEDCKSDAPPGVL